VVFIPKRVRLPWYAHPTRAVFVEPDAHAFIDARDPTWNVIFDIMLVECIYHLTHIMKSITKCWMWNVCETEGLYYVFEAPEGDVFIQSKRGAFEFVDWA